MARYECNACHGTYDDQTADAAPYYHVCAQILMIRGRFYSGGVSLRPRDQWAGYVFFESQKAAKAAVEAGLAPALAVVILNYSVEQRQGHRDENPDPTKPRQGNTHPPKEHGHGRTPAPELARARDGWPHAV